MLLLEKNNNQTPHVRSLINIMESSPTEVDGVLLCIRSFTLSLSTVSAMSAAVLRLQAVGPQTGMLAWLDVGDIDETHTHTHSIVQYSQPFSTIQVSVCIYCMCLCKQINLH